MAIITVSDINNENATLYNIGSSAKLTTKLPTALQTSTGNNVSKGSKVTPANLDVLKTAIKTLESNFSNNCCQSNCTSHKTSSFCQVQCYNTTKNVYANCTYYKITQIATKTEYYIQYGNYQGTTYTSQCYQCS